MRVRWKKLGVVFGAGALLFAVGELVLRGQVQKNGVTPFRNSEVDGLSSELRPGFTTLYKGHEIRINAAGFRGPELPPREEGVRRVALFGDSFTFGNGIGYEDTLAVELAAAFGDGTQVLNFGVPGYNADNALALLRARVLEHEPDDAVYVFFANDIDSPITWGEISPDQTIDPYHGFPLRSAFLEWALVRAKDLLAGFGLRASKRTVERSAAEWSQWGEERVRSTLATMKALCDEHGVAFRVVSYPFLAPEGRNAFRPIDEGVATVCSELGIPFDDLLGAFDEGEDLRTYRANVFDHHPDGAANERVARFLATTLAGD